MGLIHPPLMSTYNATKASAVAIAESLHSELADRKIAVSVICPQFFRTPLVHALSKDDPEVNNVARFLMTRTWLTVDKVADRAMAGIKARKLIITPDAAAASAWLLKRFAYGPFLGLNAIIGRALALWLRRQARQQF